MKNDAKPCFHKGHRTRLRERFLKEGGDTFAYHNLVELLLFYAIPRRDTNELAHRLCERFPTPDALFEASALDLMSVEGIGSHAAALIRLLPAFYARRAKEKAHALALKDEDTVLRFLAARFTGAPEELMYLLLLDSRRSVIDCLCLGKGSGVSSSVSLRHLSERILLSKAVYVFLAHNHPNGELRPSEDDLLFTKRLILLSDELELNFCEHYLFTSRGCLPLKRYILQSKASEHR